jgi:hypothetical protein
MSSVAIDQTQVNELAKRLLEAYPKEYLANWSSDYKYIKYQHSPQLFGEQVLGEKFTEDMKRLMQAVVDHSTVAAISGNGVGKTFCAATIALWHFLCFPNSQTFLLSAPPESNLRRLLWGEIWKKVRKHKEIFEKFKQTDMQISRSEWSYVTGIAIPQSGTDEQREAKVSGKHAPHLMFILDEADGVDNACYKGIDACKSGGEARLLCLYNPRKSAGWVYKAVRDGIAKTVNVSVFTHPNVITGENIIPGAVTRNKTLVRIHECSLPVQDSEGQNDPTCFKVPDFLVGCVGISDSNKEYPPIQEGYRKIIDNRFYHQVLGIYGGTGENQLIAKDHIDAARSRWDLYRATYGENPPEGIRPIIGFDVADLGDDTSVICRRYGGWVARFEKWRGITPDESSIRVADSAKHYNAANVMVDSCGVGAPCHSLIRKQHVKATRVMVSEKPTRKADLEGEHKAEFHILRDQLWWEVREWMSSDVAMLPPDELLLEELLIVDYEERNGKIWVMSKDKMRELLGRSPDTADSLVLTFSPASRRPRVWSLT